MKWDLRMGTESAGAALYGRFWQALVEETFKDQVPRSLWNPEAFFESNSRLLDAMFRLMKEPRHPFWDNVWTPDVRETRDDVLASALQKAVAKGTKSQGRRLEAWRWGRDHTAVFRNQSLGKSGIGPIERIFNRGPFPVPGGIQQVFCTDWKISAPFGVSSVSSLRHIVDFADPSSSLAANTTGQSGHPGSRHYADMIEDWRRVRYHPTFWDPASLAASRPERLLLSPK
jgi:penicillin amidase